MQNIIARISIFCSFTSVLKTNLVKFKIIIIIIYIECIIIYYCNKTHAGAFCRTIEDKFEEVIKVQGDPRSIECKFLNEIIALPIFHIAYVK